MTKKKTTQKRSVKKNQTDDLPENYTQTLADLKKMIAEVLPMVKRAPENRSRIIKTPIGKVEGEIRIVRKLPKELEGFLPTIEEIEAELEKKEILTKVKLKKVKKGVV